MKKFLTVLLALSVVFTYTVGSAFAAYTPTDDTKTTLLTEAKAELDKALGDVDTLEGEYLRTYSPIVLSNYDGLYSDVTISKDAVKLIANDVFGEVKDLIKEAYNQQILAINNKSVGDDSVDTLAKAIDYIAAQISAADDNYDETDEISGLITSKYADDAVEAEMAVKKANANAEFDKAVAALNQYSTKLPETANVSDDNGVTWTKYWSNQKIAEETIAAAREAVNAKIFDVNKKSEVTRDLGLIDTILNSVVNVDKDGKYIVKYNSQYVYVKGATSGLIPTITEEDEADRTLAEEKAYQIERINGEATLQKASVRKALNDALKTASATDKVKINAALENLNADFDAVIEVATAKINYETQKTEVQSEADTWINTHIAGMTYVAPTYAASAVVTTCLNNVKFVDELEALAAKMKAETGFNGTHIYDADAVDKALEADIKTVYTTNSKGTALQNLAPSEDVVKAEMKKVIGSATDTTVTLDKTVYATVGAWENAANTAVYDDENAEKVLTIAKETKAAIRAAKTVAEVDTAFKAGYEKYDAVPTLAEQNKYISSVAAKEAIDKYKAKLAAALATKKADYGTAKFEKDYEDTTNLVNNLSANYLQKSYNSTDMEANYQKALNEITNLKSKAELKAEADAINSGILALGTVTLADEEKVLTLADREQAFTEYKQLIGVTTGYTTYDVTSYKNQVALLVKAELDKAYKAIGVVTVEDEADIDAFAAKVEAYDDNYTPASGYASKVKDLYAALTNAKIDLVEKAIGAIDASANPLDIAAIKAAREAYDALGENTINPTMYHKLLSLENLSKDYIINATESLKISVSTKLYTKSNKIRVNWKVKDGDASAITGYQVYKSTKAQTGYKFMGKTTKSYMDNKKNLKKGQRYFYKVRAYVDVDGERYYSDWSNKGNRIYK